MSEVCACKAITLPCVRIPMRGFIDVFTIVGALKLGLPPTL